MIDRRELRKINERIFYSFMRTSWSSFIKLYYNFLKHFFFLRILFTKVAHNFFTASFSKQLFIPIYTKSRSFLHDSCNLFTQRNKILKFLESAFYAKNKCFLFNFLKDTKARFPNQKSPKGTWIFVVARSILRLSHVYVETSETST